MKYTVHMARKLEYVRAALKCQLLLLLSVPDWDPGFSSRATLYVKASTLARCTPGGREDGMVRGVIL